MPVRVRPMPTDSAAPLLVLARDHKVVRAARRAALDLGLPRPVLLAEGREALAHLFSPGGPPRQMVCQPSAAGDSWPALLATARDPFAPTGIVMVREDRPHPHHSVAAVAPRPKALAEALQRMAGHRRSPPVQDARDLELGMARGEITVRYQPVFRIADQRPVLLEGLARWHREDEIALSPDSFVPLAERSGQVRALAEAVARAAFRELAPGAMRIGASLSLNLPLGLLLERDVVGWLQRLQREARFPTSALVLELTETTPVRDRPALRRALLRLGAAGYPVLIDDMSLEEDRAGLMDLPFAGIKLDRHLVEAMPVQRRARAEVERLIARAHARRMTVTAEGVSDARLWRAVAQAGADNAQGYAISRPLPAAALPAWAATRRGGLRLRSEREA